MDAMRYLIMTGMAFARTEPDIDEDDKGHQDQQGRSRVTGY